ncbi:hypothetical protein EOD39_15835 [Acipenser ruthenus]|uniref:Uncharacterized protein n=1 Tax=Acipenser ruthenus TaxID=7906 RepID=A0A444V7A4_ACIRT|nr:hypothetical protein EOD39_15835 [Acipenser ruthenus]
MVMQHLARLGLTISSALTDAVHNILGTPAGLQYDARIPVRRQSSSYSGLSLPVQQGSKIPLVQFPKLLVRMAAAISAMEQGLLRMRLLKAWLNAFHLHPMRDRHHCLTVSCMPLFSGFWAALFFI